MASFWRVARDGIDLPMVMKMPLLRPGEDPFTIIGYEIEQMNFAAACRTACAAVHRGRRF
jgi:hypothetical protein